MRQHLITEVASAKRFIVAGNSRFTLVSQKTSNRFTYRVRRPRNVDDPNLYWVNVRSNRPGGSEYEFIGTLKANGEFKFSHRSFFDRTDPRIIGFDWFWNRLLAGSMPTDVEMWHEGRCGRCSRPLTDPESIESGYGPECRQKRLAA